MVFEWKCITSIRIAFPAHWVPRRSPAGCPIEQEIPLGTSGVPESNPAGDQLGTPSQREEKPAGDRRGTRYGFVPPGLPPDRGGVRGVVLAGGSTPGVMENTPGEQYVPAKSPFKSL